MRGQEGAKTRGHKGSRVQRYEGRGQKGERAQG